MRLLADIRDVFGESDHLTSAALLDALHGLDDAPWFDWYGKPLTARGLAKLLAPYRVGSRLRRIDGGPSRGYFRADFADAWTRYAPRGEPATSVTSVTPSTNRGSPCSDVTDVTDVTDSPGGANGSPRGVRHEPAEVAGSAALRANGLPDPAVST
jgi:hypothetical protein